MLLPNGEDGKFVISQQKTRCAVSNVETVEVGSTAHDKCGPRRNQARLRDPEFPTTTKSPRAWPSLRSCACLAEVALNVFPPPLGLSEKAWKHWSLRGYESRLIPVLSL